MNDMITPAFGIYGAEQLTEKLRQEFDVVCRENNVHQGLGPPMAYFETDTFGRVRRYVYSVFSMGGEMPPGMPESCTDLPDEVIKASVRVFRDWLKPNRTLVWREKPEVGRKNGKWTSYWRCIQLEDDARRIDVRWSL